MDGFQGQEKEAIVLSLVRSNAAKQVCMHGAEPGGAAAVKRVSAVWGCA